MREFIKKHKIKTVKFTVLGLISLLYLGRSFNDFRIPYVKGDGFEYILMTEAISNHFTPNVTLDDIVSFKKKFEQTYTWNDFYKRDLIDNQIEKFKNSLSDYKETINGFYANKNKKWYSYHFFFYSYINLPVYIIGQHYGPIRTFYITNALLVILACVVLLFYTPFVWYNSILAALSFAFSAAYWYLSWQHTEIITMTLVTLALVNFFNKKMYWAMFFVALACLQNQPLALLFGFIAIVHLFQVRFAKPDLIKTFLLGIIVLLPPMFYYFNFETTNLIKDAGFLDTKYITFNRWSGFYFDINQGMILTIPFILLCYIFMLLNQVVKVVTKKIAFELSMLLPLVLIAISISICTMGNWNHGMAIINRYASWLSVFVMIHTFYLINNLSEIKSAVLFNYFFLTQCFTTLYHQQFNDFDWSSAKHTPLAKWVLRNHAELYNPDPYIFAVRSQLNTWLSEGNSPFIYFHHELVKKVMVHKDKVDGLKEFGIDEKNIAKIKANTDFNYGWGYVNPEYFKSTLTGAQIKNVIRERNIRGAYGKILGSSVWKSQIEQKAKDWGKTFDEVLRMDAEYIVSLDEKAEVE